MASAKPTYLRLLWVPIITALIAAAIVTMRGCGTEHPPTTGARESGRR